MVFLVGRVVTQAELVVTEARNYHRKKVLLFYRSFG
jgi:hypothetical protein